MRTDVQQASHPPPPLEAIRPKITPEAGGRDREERGGGYLGSGGLTRILTTDKTQPGGSSKPGLFRSLHHGSSLKTSDIQFINIDQVYTK